MRMVSEQSNTLPTVSMWCSRTWKWKRSGSWSLTSTKNSAKFGLAPTINTTGRLNPW